MGSSIPLAGEASAIFYTAEGQPIADAQHRPRAYRHRVAPGFFATLGISLLAGRDFIDADVQQPDATAVIVGESVAPPRATRVDLASVPKAEQSPRGSAGRGRPPTDVQWPA